MGNIFDTITIDDTKKEEKNIFDTITIATPPESKTNIFDTIATPQKTSKNVFDEISQDAPRQVNVKNIPQEDRFGSGMKNHPNVYGVFGVIQSLLPYANMIDPSERDKFMGMDQQHQTRTLLWDALESSLLIAPMTRGGKYVASKIAEASGKWFASNFPKTYAVLTKELGKGSIGVKQEAGDLLKTRIAEIDKGMLESQKFIVGIENRLSKKELEALPFYRQKIKDLDVLKNSGREDLASIIENPSEEFKAVEKDIGKYYDEAHKFLKENWGDVSFVQDYVTQIWNIPKQRMSEVVNYFATKNPFLNKRTIPTIEEGIKLGLEPKTTNIADLLRIYDQFRIKTVHNFQFAKDLTNLTDDAGNKLVMRVDKAPVDWVEINHPALNKAMYVGKTQKTITAKDTTKTITETLEKIRTIERTTPGGAIEGETNGRIKALEGVVEGALEARGMTQGEASNYLNRLKVAYANKGVVAGEPTEVTSETVKRSASEVLSEINKKYPVDIPILQKVPVKVHPDIADEVRLVFDQPFSHKAITALETVNAFAKKGMLSISFFHHMALTESAFSTGIGKKAISLWSPRKIYRAMKYKDYEIFKNMELAKDSIDHGVKYGALEDVQRSKVQKTLEGLEYVSRNIPVANKLTKMVRGANELWDRSLWDYYHNSLKLFAYEENVLQGMKTAGSVATKRGVPLSDAEITAVKENAARFVNDSFGGQNWDLQPILGNPKMRQMLHWGLLAPDWTLSTLKQAAAPVTGAIEYASGNKASGMALAKSGGAFWLRAGIYFNIIAQTTNYYNTKRDYGKGRFTWENAPGHELNVYSGKNEDGTERYLRMGKQFREVLEWGQDPIGKLGSKSAPVLREGIRQFAAHDPGSGYPTEWADLEGKKAIVARLKSIGTMGVPFSLRAYIEDRPKNFMFTLPASKGMTNYKTVKLFKEAITKKDEDGVKHVYISALQNNLNAKELFKSANSAVKADMTYNDKLLARDIYDELRTVDPLARVDALMVYKNKGILTREVYNQLLKFYENEEDVKTQKILHGIK